MSGFNPKNPNKYQGTDQFLIPFVTRNREPTGADYRQPETGRLYVLGSIWQVGKNPTTGIEGDLWMLSKIVANVAYWIKSSGSMGPLLEVQVDAATGPGVNPVTPDGSGLMTVEGSIVANHSIPIRTHTTALNEYDVEVQYATSAASTDPDIAGMASFNSAQFSVDGSGFVSLSGGGQAIDSLGVQATSGSGTNPVLPDVNGKIETQGALIAAGTNPVRSVSPSVNTVEIEVQTSQAIAAADSTKVGLSNFSSLDFSVDSNGFVQSKAAAPATGIRNLGMNYNAGTGTFTILGQDGSALSAGNPAYVTLPSKATPGTFVTVPVTANQTFIDDNGASTIIGNLFGLTTSIAITVDMPFWVYAVLNDSENAISFMISRYPNTLTSPVSGKIAKTGSAVAASQGSFFALSNPTVTDYDQNPCLSIGSFRMQMSAADDWTVQTLINSDGIGKFQIGSGFSFPPGQFGTASGKYFLDNGGTAPAFTTSSYVYIVDMTNTITVYTAFGNASTAGVGVVDCLMGLPYGVSANIIPGGYNVTAATYSILICNQPNPGATNTGFAFVNDGGSGLLSNANIALTTGQGVTAVGFIIIFS